MSVTGTPCVIDSPAAWRGADLGSIAALGWPLDAGHRAELSAALGLAMSRIRTDGVTLHALSSADFPLDRCARLLDAVRADVVNGRGAALLRGMPEVAAGAAEVLFWGLGLYLGDAEPQDAAGARLHHVRDIGAQVTGTDNIRGFQTNAALDFHNDGGEAFLLYCLQQVPRGGESLLVSAVAAYNELLTRRPDLAHVLEQPIDFDARAQQLVGEQRLQRVPVFVREGGRFCALYKRGYIQLGQRFAEARRLSRAQIEALDQLDQICRDPALHLRFLLRRGDILIASNLTMLHARQRYDNGPGAARHLLRLWLTLHDGALVPAAYARTREFGMTWRRQQARAPAAAAD